MRARPRPRPSLRPARDHHAEPRAVPYDEIIREGIVGSTFLPSLTQSPRVIPYSPLRWTEYKRMADAIAALAQSSGKPPLSLSLCEWGEVRPPLPSPSRARGGADARVWRGVYVGAAMAVGAAVRAELAGESCSRRDLCAHGADLYV